MALQTEELRLGVVLNGGVSLAVWMGGAVHELDRVRRADGAYGRLLELTQSTARIDVVAGASAGGINGAALATAIARGTTVDGLRELWIRAGDIEGLLRPALERDAPSLLEGDGALLRRLHEALLAVAGNGAAAAPPSADNHPLHLTITGTTLRGQVRGYADRYGAVVPDVDHRVEFRFRRGRVGEVRPDREPDDLAAWPDDFAPASGEPAIARLALAARSSASFPVAFEPSFVPIAPGDADAEHPAMGGVASFDQSRWVIDGGVLVNTPFRPALDAIATLPADRPVRRVLAYVVPHPVPATTKPDDRTKAPSAVEVVVDAVSKLPRVQSIRRELEEIERNNRRVDQRRGVRDSLLAELGEGDPLGQAASLMLPTYLRTRRAAAADDVLALVLDGWTRAPSRPPPREAEVERARARMTTMDVPWLPSPEARVPPDGWDEPPIEAWSWGIAPVENAANLVLQLLRGLPGRDGAGVEGTAQVRRDYHAQLARLRRLQAANADYWRDVGRDAQSLEPVTDLEAGVLRGWYRQFSTPAGELALQLGDTLRRVALAFPTVDDAQADLRALLRLLYEAPSAAAVVGRLLALDVVQRAAGADLMGIEQRIDLLLVSGDAGNAFGLPADAERKLTGLQAGHFGAFYKASWRANDWMWGRLDAADRLVRTLVDARRIQERLRDGESVDQLLDAVREIAFGDHAMESDWRAWLRRRWDNERAEDAIRTELVALAGPHEPDPSALETVHRAVRRRVQLEILRDEIPAVREGVRADRAAGASPNAAGDKWERALNPDPLDVDATIAAFKSCAVRDERIGDEVPSDRMTRVSTRGLALVASVLTGAVAKVRALRFVKPVLATARGPLVALYLLGRGVLASSRSASFLVALVLGLGGAVLGLFLVGIDVPGFLVLFGVAAVVAGVGLGLIRQKWGRLIGAVAFLVVAGVGYYGLRTWSDRPDWVDTLATVLAVLVLTGAAMALGYTGKPAKVTEDAKDAGAEPG
jgi:patatin-related protein